LASVIEARLAPAIEDSIDQMEGYRLFGIDQFVALLAFPHAPLHAFFLFVRYTHSISHSPFKSFLRHSI